MREINMLRRYFKMLNILLVALMVLGSISGIYATITQDNHEGKTIYVAKNGIDRNDGLTVDTPKRNIASAISSANPGDTIHVGPGTYQENLRIDNNITLIGENQENTIIDGNHVYNCIHVCNANVKIIGFTIKNGVQHDHVNYDFGGGIYNHAGSVLTVENSTIANNTAEYGGGIYNKGTLTLRNVNMIHNIADIGGGGIDSDKGTTVLIEDSLFTDNKAATLVGGGIFSGGSTTIKRSTIEDNQAKLDGGGISSNFLVIEDSVIKYNIAGINGGGIIASELHIYNTTITNNKATDGGGIYTFIVSYVDDLTVSLMKNNEPNNFGGIPYKPA
jgi:predicted outer membrane repeat protein